MHRLALHRLLVLVITATICSACGSAEQGPAPPPAPTASPVPTESALPAPPRADPTLVARATLFGNPDRASAQISPDGKQLAFLAPKAGVLNVFVAPIDKPSEAKPVTDDKKRGVRRYFWAYTNQHIVYLQDKGGDENWRVYSVDLGSGEEKDLTPLEKVQARIAHVSHRKPNSILVQLNDRDPKLHDVYRIDIRSGKRSLVQKNTEGFLYFLADDSYRIRLGVKMRPDGGQQLMVPQGKEKWKLLADVGPEDMLTTNPVGFNRSGSELYLIDSRGRDLAALTTMGIATGKQQVLVEDPKADISDLIIHPTTKKVQGAAATYGRKTWHLLDEQVKADLAILRKASPGDVELVSGSLDDQHWIAAFLLDDGPVRYYHYDRKAKKARFLFTNRTALEKLALAKMHPVEIPSRDGMTLVSYLSLPPKEDPDADGKPAKPLPMVLLVHGGPWGRDRWGFNSWHQWLANRGYAVLSVNYRGSTGFGKAFINAANGQWAGKMHDDLIDAVQWAAAGGVAEPQRVAIMGGSYGGYATLVGLTFTPERFACGVDIVGPSSLITLLENIPPYWAPMLPMLTTRVGDPKTEAGRKHLLERSPLGRADQIARPLLIGQGANDPRVKQQEADQIVKAMQAKQIPVTYVLYPDEGHGFARPANRMSFNAVAEIFLAQCLGGPYQPVGDDFKGASISVPAGADHVHGLAEALKAAQP